MNGVIYIATDSMKFVNMSIESAKTIRQYLPPVTIKLYSDIEVNSDAFDDYEKIQNLTPGGQTDEFCEGKLYFENKICILGNSPFKNTLYLDCDVTALRPTNPFSLLNRFDLAAAHAPCRLSRHSRLLPVPVEFPDFNLGILAFRNNPDFFTRWLHNYIKYPRPHDQPSFRLSVWESEVKIATLPPEYNHRPEKLNSGQELVFKHG